MNRLKAKLIASLAHQKGSVALQYALISFGVSLALFSASSHTGQKVNAQLEAVLDAMQKQGGLPRLIP